MITQFRRLVAALLILTLVLPLPVRAGLVATDAALDQIGRASCRERV